MPLDMIGVGPRGYDFMVGRWECAESAWYLGKQPAAWEMKVQVVRDGRLLQIMSANGRGILVAPMEYSSETKTWSISETNKYGDTVSSQTTQDTGQKTLWVGWELSDERDNQSYKIHERDTLTFLSLDEFRDIAERPTGSGGTWETIQSDTCQRSG